MLFHLDYVTSSLHKQLCSFFVWVNIDFHVDSRVSHSVHSTEHKCHFFPRACPLAGKRTRASSSMARCTYQVSLSSGEDTSFNFSDHLYTALVRAGINTCRADDGIERGHDIEAESQRAAEESKISLIVFSKGYSSSEPCLNELLKILQRRKAVVHKDFAGVL